MASVDWSKALNLSGAANNVRGEFVGDWYRDPWGWPELGYMMARDPKIVTNHLDSRGARRAALIDVPKENWGSRPAIVMDIVDRLVYQALVDRLSVDLIGSLPSSVYGWRLLPGTPTRGEYSHNSLQWDGYRNHLGINAAMYPVALKTDIVSFFASIPLQNVRDAVDDKAPQGATMKRLFSLLDGFDTIPERAGLPQRSTASAVLANMMLAPLDDVLEHYATDVPALVFLSRPTKVGRRRSYARWMDDMWLFCENPARARRAQTDLQDVARGVGLNINAAKTVLLEGEDVAADAMQIEHSAVDDALDNRHDPAPLEELIDGLLDAPDTASRTSLKFVATRMNKHRNTYRLQEFASLACRMPHAADALVPLFKKSFTSPSLQEWFLDYANSEWAAFQWSTAQYARLFASSRRPRKVTRDFYADKVADADSSLPLLSVAAQRLAAWDPAVARAVIRAALARTSHPQNRRVLVLAALQAGESRGMVRRWLRQEPENVLTLNMLEHYSFAAPRVGADFAG